LESDYEQAAIALMQFMHGHQIPGLADLQSDFAKAARELLNAYTQGTGGRKAKADFSRAAKALRECGLGPVIG
jgi:hypothetical protein